MAFDLVGDAKAAWLNGQPVTPGAHFIVNAQTGANVLVLQLPQDRPVTSIRLSSREANFALE